MGAFKSFAAVGATVLAFCAFSGQANAITVPTIIQDPDILPPPLTTFFQPGDSNTGIVQSAVGSVPGTYRSPFEKNCCSGQFESPVVGYQNSVYTSIQAGSSATYNVSAGANVLSILWGSPDDYNTISFYDGVGGLGTLIYSITGNSPPIHHETLGHVYVVFTFANILFKSVVLSTGANAFEFAALAFSNTPNQTPLPLPAAFPLFAAGLGGLAWLARRSRKRKAAAAMSAA